MLAFILIKNLKVKILKTASKKFYFLLFTFYFLLFTFYFLLFTFYFPKYKITPPVANILNNASGIRILQPKCIN